MVVESVEATEEGYYLSLTSGTRINCWRKVLLKWKLRPDGVHSLHMLWLNPVKAENSRKNKPCHRRLNKGGQPERSPGKRSRGN